MQCPRQPGRAQKRRILCCYFAVYPLFLFFAALCFQGKSVAAKIVYAFFAGQNELCLLDGWDYVELYTSVRGKILDRASIVYTHKKEKQEHIIDIASGEDLRSTLPKYIEKV